MKPDTQSIINLHNTLLEGLSPEEVEELRSIMLVKKHEPGELIIEEGDQSDSIFIIQKGNVEVVKRGIEDDEWYTLAELKAGESIGEVSLLDNQPRSASVRATTEVTLLEINISDLNSRFSKKDSLASRIKINLARETSRRLRNTNQVTVQTLHNQLEDVKARVAIGTIVSWLLVGICIYVVVLKYIAGIAGSSSSTTLISVIILIVFGGMTYAAAKQSGYPLETFGLTLKKWRHSAGESTFYSLFVFAIIIFGKWLLILYHPAMKDEPLFGFVKNLQLSGWAVLGDILLYAVFTPIQEFIARGGVQSSFQEFLTGKRKNLYALLIANLMFSMTHLHLSTAFAALVFIPGLFWGWLYYRQRSLVGVCVSHLLIGLFAYYVVGFNALLQ